MSRSEKKFAWSSMLSKFSESIPGFNGSPSCGSAEDPWRGLKAGSKAGSRAGLSSGKGFDLGSDLGSTLAAKVVSANPMLARGGALAGSCLEEMEASDACFPLWVGRRGGCDSCVGAWSGGAREADCAAVG